MQWLQSCLRYAQLNTLRNTPNKNSKCANPFLHTISPHPRENSPQKLSTQKLLVFPRKNKNQFPTKISKGNIVPQSVSPRKWKLTPRKNCQVNNFPGKVSPRENGNRLPAKNTYYCKPAKRNPVSCAVFASVCVVFASLPCQSQKLIYLESYRQWYKILKLYYTPLVFFLINPSIGHVIQKDYSL